MTLKSTLTYWVECDGRDCTGRNPHRDSDYASWNDREYIREALAEDDWRERPAVDGEPSRHFCWRHWDCCEPCDGEGFADESTAENPVPCSHCDGRGWNPVKKAQTP